MPRHGELFLEARKPRVIVVRPEPVWIIDHYRVSTWYYRAAPTIGEKVVYLNDGSHTRVSRVTATRIYFDNANTMRRPYMWGRMLTWTMLQIRTRSFYENMPKTLRIMSMKRFKKSSKKTKLLKDAKTLYV